MRALVYIAAAGLPPRERVRFMTNMDAVARRTVDMYLEAYADKDSFRKDLALRQLDLIDEICHTLAWSVPDKGKAKNA